MSFKETAIYTGVVFAVGSVFGGWLANKAHNENWVMNEDDDKLEIVETAKPSVMKARESNPLEYAKLAYTNVAGEKEPEANDMPVFKEPEASQELSNG